MPAKRLAFGALLLALALLTGPGSRAESALVFGVLNQQSPALTAERWNPLLGYVGRVAGVPLRLRMGPTVERTNAMMAEGEFDLVFTNHNFRPEFDSLGFRVIARWGGEPARAAIVVLADSPFNALEQLGDRRMAFPSPHAFLGHAVPSVALAKALVAVEQVFSGNQEGALAQLKARRVEAAAVNARFGEQYAQRESVALRTVYVSEPFPDLAVIVHPRLPRETVEALRRALVGMTADPTATELLAKANCPGFVAADDAEYERVRAIYRDAAQ